MAAEKPAKTSVSAGNPLANAKHEAVALKYFADPERVGWRAYKHVYPNSSETASKTAFSRLLKNADFSERLRQLGSAVADDTVMSAREVLQELSKLGRGNIQNVLIGGDNTTELIQSLRDLAPEHAATIQELTVDTYVEGHGEDSREVKRVRVKLHGKHAPLAELRRHYEPQKVEVTGEGGGPVKVETEISELELARRIAFALEAGARSKPTAASEPTKAAAKPGKR